MAQEKRSKNFKMYIAEIIWFFLLIHLFISISPTLLLKAGYDEAGLKVHSVYRVFCHQRVERTMFLFGADGPINFYSIEELQDRGALPDENPRMPEQLKEEIFGYPFVGNEDVGYKAALCIRDISMYLGILITGLIYFIYTYHKGKIVKFDWRLILIIMIPMAVDGIFQLVAEIFSFPWVPEAYFASIGKRVFTGVLFGIGFALLIFPNLKESGQLWYNEGISDGKDKKEAKERKSFNLKERWKEYEKEARSK